MAANMLLQRAAMRSLLQASTRSQPAILRHTMCLHMQARFASDAPHPQTIMDTGFWKSLVPKPLRKENRQARAKKNKKKGEWNPVTFYIIMFLFIGSMSIQMIALRNSTDRYKRQATVRIAQLKEIVERIQNGEDVDVEKLLGTGEPQRETDWEEVLRAIERDEATPQKNTAQKPKSAASKKAATPEPEAAEPAQPKKPANFGNFF